MKVRLAVLTCVLSLLGIIFAGCPVRPPMEYSASEIALNDITCDMCVEKIESVVSHLEGVQEVTVSLKEKLASVTFEPSKLKLSDIEHAIAEAGFTANSIVRNETAHQDLPGCCQQVE